MIDAISAADAAKIVESLERLSATALVFSETIDERRDLYCLAFAEAAQAIRTLSQKQEDSALIANTYTIAISKPTGEMQVTLLKDKKQLAVLVTNPPEAYELGTAVLKCYDELEGIA